MHTVVTAAVRSGEKNISQTNHILGSASSMFPVETKLHCEKEPISAHKPKKSRPPSLEQPRDLVAALHNAPTRLHQAPHP